MLDRTVRTYAPIRDAEAPEEWRAFQQQLTRRLNAVVPRLVEIRQKVAAARSQADIARATSVVKDVAGGPELRVPASLVERAPACRVLTEGAPS
jgi:hypothetical protein